MVNSGELEGGTETGVILVLAGTLVQCSADRVLLGACYSWVLVCSCGWV
jgi:hypothetical protein